jgi:ATP-binding cassette subfamily F protein uup
LEEFNGVLVVVSHDRLFTDKVTNHLFVFEGNGIVKDYLGSLSDYAECLVEQENIKEAAAGGGNSGTIVDSDRRKGSYKEDKEKRLERRNSIKKIKRDIDKIEPVLEKLRAKVIMLQMEIDTSSDKGWTVLADLTDKLQKVNDEIEVKEMEWLELSEVLEGLEVEEESNLSTI